MAKSRPVYDESDAEIGLPDGRDPTVEDEIDDVIWKPKLSVSQINCNPAEAKSTRGKVFIATFVGLANGIKTVTNPQYPDVEFVALTGTFLATNRQTGDRFRSGILYLPTGFHEGILEALSSALDRANKDSPYDQQLTQFALDVYAVPSSNPAGYSYEAKSLVAPDKKEPIRMLDQLADRRRARMLALEDQTKGRKALPAS